MQIAVTFPVRTKDAQAQLLSHISRHAMQHVINGQEGGGGDDYGSQLAHFE